jgi:hypothetical protein
MFVSSFLSLFSYTYNLPIFKDLLLAIMFCRQPQCGFYLLRCIYVVCRLQAWLMLIFRNPTALWLTASCVPCMSIMQRTLVVSCRKSLNIQINFIEQTTKVFFPGDEIPLYTGDTRNFDHICSGSRSRMGRWAAAQGPILVTTITLHRLAKRGINPCLRII